MAKANANPNQKTAPAPAKVAPATAKAEDITASAETGDEEASATPRSKKVDRSQAGQKRFYDGKQEIDHDLFKLELAVMKKNVSYNDLPDYEKIEHVHMFHTIDSSGKRQETSTAVGGHFHPIIVKGAEDGVPTLEVGPPHKHVIKKIRGRKVRVAIPLTEEDPEGDTHTHTVIYLKSEKIKLRQANANFASYEAEVHAKQNPTVDGIISA